MKLLKIYYCTQSQVDGWDTYDSCVVVAKDEESARNMNPGEWGNSWARTPNKVKVELIGKAVPGQTEGVLISSFNAG